MKLLSYSIIKEGFADVNLVLEYKVKRLKKTQFLVTLYNNHIEAPYKVECKIENRTKWFKQLDQNNIGILARETVEYLRKSHTLNIIEVF